LGSRSTSPYALHVHPTGYVGSLTEFVYILSPSYSGSTLLTYLLATHPDIATVGELKASAMGDAENYVCSCGVRIRECPFWLGVARRLRGRRVPFDVGDFGTHFRPDGSMCSSLLGTGVRGRFFEAARWIGLRLMLECRRTLRAILEKNRALAEVVCEIQGGATFLDSSKDPIRLKHFASSGLWNVKAIWLTRDGRGSSCSYMRHHDARMDEAAAAWRAVQEECERVLAGMCRGAWTSVRYEDLCRDPEGTTRRLFGFLGCNGHEARLDFRSIDHHILGNQMRLRSASEIYLDERWRSELDAGDLGVFDNVAGEVNRRYGYE